MMWGRCIIFMDRDYLNIWLDGRGIKYVGSVHCNQWLVCCLGGRFQGPAVEIIHFRIGFPRCIAQDRKDTLSYTDIYVQKQGLGLDMR